MLNYLSCSSVEVRMSWRESLKKEGRNPCVNPRSAKDRRGQVTFALLRSVNLLLVKVTLEFNFFNTDISLLKFSREGNGEVRLLLARLAFYLFVNVNRQPRLSR